MLKMNYNPQTDILQLLFNGSDYTERKEQKPDLVIYYDKEGKISGVELKHASNLMTSSWSFEFEPPIQNEQNNDVINWQTSSAEEIIENIRAGK